MNFIEKLRQEGIPVKDNGMVECPKCNGDGFLYQSFDDWDAKKCHVCNGRAEISPKVYRRIN